MASFKNKRPVRVLATRPRPQNREWCERLQQAGLAVLPVPVLTIEPVQEPSQRGIIKSLILDFDQFSKVVFVSQNAVDYALHWLDEYWPQWPVGIEYFAVGRATAARLQRQGMTPRFCHQSMNTETLLAMPELKQVEGEKILICRGLGGRPRLGLELEARGARVSYAEFYERRLPPEATDAVCRSDFLQAGYQEVLSAFSGESLDNLVEVLDGARVDNWHQLPLLVPGERVAHRARELGFEEMVVATNATDDAMLEALEGWLPRRGSLSDANA